MSNILDEIVGSKHREVAERRELYPPKLLEKSVFFASPTVSLAHYLRRSDKIGVIAEIKRRSPSKGALNPHISIEKLSVGYMQAGASALSVLTDGAYFGGSSDDLRIARKFNFCPILRKDFTVDEYQVIEAKAIGADAILLIAAAVSPEKTQALARLAKSLGLEVILEVHSEAELASHLCDEVQVVGVNNRDLQSFTVNLETSERIRPLIPNEKVSVAESGISNAETIVRLKKVGYHGFLIGEAFMRHSRPEEACRTLIEQVERLERE